jgi:hypothetical protein
LAWALRSSRQNWSRSWGKLLLVAMTMPPVATHQAAMRLAIQSLPEPKHDGTATLGWSRTASAIVRWIDHGSSSRMSVMKPTGSVR